MLCVFFCMMSNGGLKCGSSACNQVGQRCMQAVELYGKNQKR